MDARDALALFCCLLLAAGCIFVAAGLVSLIGYWWMRRFRDDVYEPEAADAPDDMMAVASAAGFGNGPHAVDLEAEAQDAYRRYRAGERIEAGAPRELP